MSASLLRGDFRKNPLKASSVDELHSHFILSAPKINKHGRQGKPIKRYVDRRRLNGLAETGQIFGEAARVLRKGGRLIVTESEMYITEQEMREIAAPHGFKKVKTTRDLEEIGKHSNVATMAKHQKADVRDSIYMIEFEKT